VSGAALLDAEPIGLAPAEGARQPHLSLELLRDGVADEPVFLFPGSGGDARELARLAESLATPRRIFGISYSADGEGVDLLGRLAAATIAALRPVQPHGPYRLVGYSFGALVAVEVARRLKLAREKVAAPILIDAYYDQKFWPAKAWFSGHLRRARSRLAEISRRPPYPALRELTFRAGRLAQRLHARWGTPRGASRPTTRCARTIRPSIPAPWSC
jgi:thioesterase domain-containing protein